ncbi:MAG: DUF4105 domain-containing protein [Pirellulales bacterium]
MHTLSPPAGPPTKSTRLALAIVLVCALSGCQALRPTNDANWSPDQAVLPTAEYHGNLVTVHNVRNCDYRSTTDYVVRHEDRTYDLNDLRSVDFIVVPFKEAPQLAHTMLSFGFDHDDYLAVSVEIRKRRDESFSAWKGMFPHYEIMYVAADERDVIALRTNHRHDDVYVHRTRATPEQARALFVDVVARMNKLAVEPEYYNTFTNNCTTNIRRHVNDLAPGRVPYDYRVMMPGYSDQMAYNLGMLATSEPFPLAREHARVNELAFRYREAPDFSRQIRR